MPQVIVRLRPGSHYGRFCQLSVKEGTLSVITPRFLMRVVFHKFLKFWKFCRNFRDTEVYGGADRFWRNKNKKQKTQLPELSRPFIWPRYDLQLNCWCFPFSMYHFPLYHAPGSFPMQNFPHFHPTLAEPIKQDPGGILFNWSNSSASVVCNSNSLTNSRSAEGWREKDDR